MPGKHRVAPKNIRDQLTSKENRQWAHIYNSARESGDSEESSIAQATGVVMENKSLIGRRMIPVRTVVKRDIRRARKSADALESCTRALSGIAKKLIEVEQAAKLAVQDLDDMRYPASDEAIQSTYTNAPKIMKALKQIEAATHWVSKANSCVASAKSALRPNEDDF